MSFDPEVVGATAARLLRFVRIEHTIFTLPMAYAAAVLTGGVLDIWKALFIGTAVFGLRTAGMAWNNIVDYPIDRLNPRTQGRMLVSGKVSFREAYGMFIFGVALFLVSAALLGTWPTALSLPYLVVVLTYPYAKRLHCMPHLHLGLVYALVPLGAAIAMYPHQLEPAIANTPWLLVLAATLWVAGFDIIYSKGDVEFDRQQRLGSIPACFGAKAADLAAVLFLSTSAMFYLANYLHYGLGLLGLVPTAVGAALEVMSAIAGIRGQTALGFNMNLAVGLLIPLGIFLGYFTCS
ncbi:MAG: UbiA-like polyprenyltransferase [Pyrobaculum sp.]